MTHWQVQPPQSLNTHALDIGRGDHVLSQNLSFSVAAGRGLLLRGPNGAGQSTLLLTLARLLPALAGDFEWVGHDADEGRALHYCGHRNAVRPRLTTAETLDFWAAINGRGDMSGDAALARVGLTRQAKLDAGYLSAGQQRRLALARLLVSPRPVWLLDEPSAALDAAGHTLLATLISEHLAAGGMAIIATHDDIAVPDLSVLTLEGRR